MIICEHFYLDHYRKNTVFKSTVSLPHSVYYFIKPITLWTYSHDVFTTLQKFLINIVFVIIICTPLESRLIENLTISVSLERRHALISFLCHTLRSEISLPYSQYSIFVVNIKVHLPNQIYKREIKLTPGSSFFLIFLFLDFYACVRQRRQLCRDVSF